MEPALTVRRPLRVALLATSVEFGGIERVLLNLLGHMQPGIELVPVVFTRTDTKETSFFDRLRAMGVSHEILYVNSVRPVYIANPIVNLVQAIALFRKHRFDLIHSHGYRADLFALAVARWFRLPVVSTCHGFTPNNRRLRFYHALNTFVLRSFTRVIAVSARMKEDLLSHGLEGSRVDVVTNAVADVSAAERETSRQLTRSRLGIGDGDFVFGYVGRLSVEKGLEYLVEAAEHLTATHRSARILVVGDGPRRGDLEHIVRDRGLAEAVRFVGFHEDPAPWYAAMDAFVLPSLTEGTPMALLEAMAHRLPVIASAVGGVPAVVSDRKNGLLVPAADPASLSAAMQTVMCDAALRNTLSDEALRSVRGSYDVDSWIGNVREVYRRSLEARPV